MSTSGELFDYLLGEGDRADRESTRRCVAEQPELALELAELGLMLDSLRSEARRWGQVSPGLGLRLRYVTQRRAELRGPRLPDVTAELARVLLIAAGVTLFLYLAQGLVSTSSVESTVAGLGDGPAVVTLEVSPGEGVPHVDHELSALLAVEQAPVTDASFLRSLERYSARALPADSGSWLQADNLLRRMREEQRLRRSAVERRRVLTALGSPDLGDRIDSLAATIAERARAGKADGDVSASSLTLRALLASGSTPGTGPHQDVVRSCALGLVNQLPELDGVLLIRALAALSDLAVVDGAPLDALVAIHCDRLARSILRPPCPQWRSSGAPASSLLAVSSRESRGRGSGLEAGARLRRA